MVLRGGASPGQVPVVSRTSVPSHSPPPPACPPAPLPGLAGVRRGVPCAEAGLHLHDVSSLEASLAVVVVQALRGQWLRCHWAAAGTAVLGHWLAVLVPDLLLLLLPAFSLAAPPSPHPRACTASLWRRYEWVTTPKYDPTNREHVACVDEIIIGNGLPVGSVAEGCVGTGAKAGVGVGGAREVPGR